MNFGEEASITITLKVRENIVGKMEDVKLELKFKEIIELYISEDFTSKYYSDITLVQVQNKEYYLSLDPYDNLNVPNLQDNFVIKSAMLEIVKVD
jgi:hypothetical protein